MSSPLGLQSDALALLMSVTGTEILRATSTRPSTVAEVADATQVSFDEVVDYISRLLKADLLYVIERGGMIRYLADRETVEQALNLGLYTAETAQVS